MAAAVRQFKFVQNASQTNWTAAFDSAVLAGSLIVVVYEVYGTSTDPTSLSDNLNAGNYTQDLKTAQNTDAGSQIWFYSHVNSAAGSLTLSVAGPSAFYQTVVLLELTGAATASPVDATGSATAVAGIPSAFTLTTIAANDIIIAGLATYDTSSTIVAGSGLTLIQSDISTGPGQRMTTMKHEDAGAAGGNTITYTYSGGLPSQDSALGAVAYKSAASGASSAAPVVGVGTLTGLAGIMDRGLFPRSAVKGT